MTEAIRGGDVPGVQLRQRVTTREPIQAVWTRLTEAEEAGRWWAPFVTGAPGVDETLQFGGRFSGGSDAAEADRIEEVQTLVWSPVTRWVVAFRRTEADWGVSTRLTFDVLPRSSEETELSLFQEGFQHLPLSIGLTVWEQYRRRWARALERFAALARAT